MKKEIKKFFYPKGKVTALLVILSTVALVIALKNHGTTSIFHLCAYTLSAYTLTVVCLKIPAVMKGVKSLTDEKAGTIKTGNEKMDRLIGIGLDYEQRSRYLLYFSLGFNLIYAVFKLATGIYYRSFWMGALGIYYAVLASLRFSLMRSIQKETEQASRAAYRRTAWQLNFLTLVMSGVFVQMVIKNQAYHYPGVMIYAMALYAFVKIISAAVNLIKRRKDENKALAAARCISFAGALMSILALQTAMISQFGGDAVDFARTMNAIGGAVVTALLITLSALMIARSSEWKSNEKPSH